MLLGSSHMLNTIHLIHEQTNKAQFLTIIRYKALILSGF